MGEAYEIIKRGTADVMFTGGTEAAMCEKMMKWLVGEVAEEAIAAAFAVLKSPSTPTTKSNFFLVSAKVSGTQARKIHAQARPRAMFDTGKWGKPGSLRIDFLAFRKIPIGANSFFRPSCVSLRMGPTGQMLRYIECPIFGCEIDGNAGPGRISAAHRRHILSIFFTGEAHRWKAPGGRPGFVPAVLPGMGKRRYSHGFRSTRSLPEKGHGYDPE
ncbi:MAG: hypothetical protein ABI036_04755 [Fibrobacteria bacterium]